MSEKQLFAEIVKSGTWLYDNQVPHEVWIVRQNYDYYYEEGYEDAPEALNSEGEVYHVVLASKEYRRAVEAARMSLAEAVELAESIVSSYQLKWDNPTLQKLPIPYRFQSQCLGRTDTLRLVLLAMLR